MSADLAKYSILCTICARGGSKGVPGKNTRLLLGRPLIAHTIEVAKLSGLFAAIAVSSDDDSILKAARQHGADILVKRPAEMATDQAAKLPVIKHCFEAAESEAKQRFEIGVDLDATSPLRIADDVVGCVSMLVENQPCTVISAMASRRSPYFNLVELQPSGFVQLAKSAPDDIVRRQDAPRTFDLNGSVYAWFREDLLSATKVIGDRTLIYEMPDERSIDIDAPIDWEFVEFLMAKRQQG